MRPCRRMNHSKRYHTNNINQNQMNNTNSELDYSALIAQDIAPEQVCCEELFRMYEKNYEYMKSLYPSIVKKLQKQVEEECDKLEHNGSCMFDEWPDKVRLDAIADAICKDMENLDTENPELQAEDLSINPLTALEAMKSATLEGVSVNPIPDYTRLGRPNWYRNLVLSLLYNEMLYRRMRYYRRRYCPSRY